MRISTATVAHACLLLRSFDIEPKPLDRIVDVYFRKHRELNSGARRAIADAIFDIIRWRFRIEDELNRQGIKRPTGEQIVMYYFENAPFGIDITPPKSSANKVAAYYSLPEWFVKNLIKQYRDPDAYKLMVAFKEEAPVTLRVNTLKVSRDELLDILLKSGHDARSTEHSPYGIALNKRVAFAADESFKRGLFEIQDEASQLATVAVRAKPGEVILDACAGAGGKTLMLAMMMKDSGAIIAADIDGRKLKELEKRAARAGIGSITSVATNDLERMKKYHGKCDAVLLDVPCSGTGTLRRAPDLALRLAEKEVASYSEQQRALLREYAPWLKSGGRLIYSTCSVFEDENERVVEDFMEKSGFESLGKGWMAEAGIDDRFVTPEGYFKALPSNSSMDGFFACAMGEVQGQ